MVKKVGKEIVKYRYLILVLFLALIILSGVLMPKMIEKVNYDLTSYLPEGYDTYDGFQFLSKNFNIHGDIEIGINATYAEAKQVAEKITKTSGVTGTTWAAILSYLPEIGVLNKDSVQFKKVWGTMTDRAFDTEANLEADTNKYNWAVLVTLQYPPSDTKSIKIFQNIRSDMKSIIGDNYSMSGMTEQATALFDTVFDEIGLYVIIAGIVVLIILLVTTNSLMEPVILLSTMAISILINLGTNIIFPSTSIITFACSAILQLGLSMDYAIFLLHQYRHELTLCPDPKHALAMAIPKSAKSIFASALTTVCGLLALLCMKFGIGYDLGLTIAKGILCSLATVLFLQPCLMLLCNKARVKTQHRYINLTYKQPVKRVLRDRKWIAAIFALLIIPIAYGAQTLNYAYLKFMPDNTDNSVKAVMAKELGNQVVIVVPDTPSQNYAFVDKMNKEFKNGELSYMLGLYIMFPQYKTDLNGTVLTDLNGDPIINTIDGKVMWNMIDSSGTLDSIDATTKAVLKDYLVDKDTGNGKPLTLQDLLGLMQLMNTFMDSLPPGTTLPSEFSMITNYVSNGYTMYTCGINPNISNESQQSFDILDKIKAIAGECFVNDNDTPKKCYFTGLTQTAYDFAVITPNDFMWVSIVSILAIFLILIFTLRSIKFPILLVLVIQAGIWLNLLMQYIFTAGAGSINFMSYLFISAIQLGATVDYAILLTTKYRDFRKRFEPIQASYLATTNSAMSITTSALIMAGACFSVFAVASNLVIKEMTFLMARGSIISAILVIFVLPALLTLIDKRNGNELHFELTPTLRPYHYKKPKFKACKFKKNNLKEQEIMLKDSDTLENKNSEISVVDDIITEISKEEKPIKAIKKSKHKD